MHVVFSLAPGGLENGVVNLCNRLDTRKFQPSVCVFEGGGALEARLDKNRVDLVTTRRYLRYDPTLPLRLAAQLQRRRIDILHTHSWGTLVEGVLAAKLAQTPVVVHGEHGTLEARPHNLSIQRWLWTNAQQVTAVASSTSNRMASIVGFPRERIEVIPNGVDVDLFRPNVLSQKAARAMFGLPSTGFLVGMVARLVPVKNHLGVFHAIAELKSRGIDVNLALVGDGPLYNELRQASHALGIAEQLHFLGEVARVHKFLSALDLFVLNSRSEGMSNTILEAMACGLPVVATSVGENPKLVKQGETGCLVADNDVESLCSALTILARDPPRRQLMGHASRLRVKERFSIHRMVRDYTDLYRRLFGEYHSGQGSMERAGHGH